MKKLSFLVMMISILLFSQCKKSATKPVNENVGLTGEMVEVTLSANTGGEKSEIDGLNIKWNVGDRLNVVGATSGLLGSVYATAVNGSSATFKGVINAVSVKQDYRFYYVGDNTFTLDSNGKYTYSVASQSGVLNGDNGVANNLQLLLGTISNVTAGTTELGAVTLTSMVSLGHFEFQLNGSPYTGVVTLTGGLATAELDAKAGTLGAGTAGTITVDAAPSERYLMLIPGKQTITFTADDGISTVLMNENTIVANHSYNNTTAYIANMISADPPTVVTRLRCTSGNIVSVGGIVTVVDEQNCEFGVVYSETDDTPTISEDCTKVKVGEQTLTVGDHDFTADLSGLTSGHTYYVRAYAIGLSGEEVYATEVRPLTCGDTAHDLPANWIDGMSPEDISVSATQVVRFSRGNLQYIGSASPAVWQFAAHQFDYLGKNAQHGSEAANIDRDLFGWGTGDVNHATSFPWQTTVNNTYYGPTTGSLNNGNAAGDNYNTYDWGHNIGDGETWFTLTKGQMEYLIARKDADENLLYGMGRVGDCYRGLIILPDDWDWSGDVEYLKPSWVPGASSTWENIYTYTDWSKMEEAGAVFLPAAGYRNGTTVDMVNSRCYYSISSRYDNNNQYFVFVNTSVIPANSTSRYLGLSVRLVQNTPTTGTGSSEPYTGGEW